MKKFGRAILASLMIGSLVVTPTFASPSVDEIEESKKAAEAEVSSLQSELQAVLEKINSLETELVNIGEKIIQAESDLAEAEEKEKQQYEDMKLRIKYMYENGETSLIETLVSAESFSDFLNKAEYVQNIHSYDRKMLQEYVATKNEIAELKTTLETEQQQLQAKQEEYGSEKENLNQTIAEKQDEVADLDAQLQAAVEAAAKAAEEAARQQAAQQAAQSAGNTASGGNTVSGGSTSSGGTSSSGSSGSSNNGYVSSGNSSVGNAIVAAASGYLGVPYVWGGTSSSGVDCSGLVYLAHKAVGITVARYSGTLGSGGKAVSASEALPGDVVCYSGHVGIYVGNGQMIHAPQPGSSVCYTSVDYAPHWFRRYW